MAAKQDQRHKAIHRLKLHLLETGLAQTSLKKLAQVAGTSDRMLLYYFADKTDLMNATLAQVAQDMTSLLSAMLPADASLTPSELTAHIATIATDNSIKPYMRLWIELIAAAARAEEPYKAIAEQIAAGFILWIRQRLNIEDQALAQSTAAMVLAMIDGLVLLDICTDGDQARKAAQLISQLRYPDTL